MGCTRSTMILLLLLVVTCISLVQGMADVTNDPFIQYPTTDDCGAASPAGSYSGHSCPIEVCTEERKACDAANQIRFKCKRTRCTPEEMSSAHANATSVCATATVCVRSTCYGSVPAASAGAGAGGSCKVRSYYKGQCCCAACDGPEDAPVDFWSFGYFTGKCGSNGRAVPRPDSKGLIIGNCMWLDAPGYNNDELSGCIQAYNWQWYVHVVCLRFSDNPAYKYRLMVMVDGPGWWGTRPGNFYLYFTEATGKRHQISLEDPNFRGDIVSIYYNSKRPTITKFQWSTKPLP